LDFSINLVLYERNKKMGDPVVMATWTHKILINGTLFGVGTEEDMTIEAEVLEKRGFAGPDEIEIIKMDGSEKLY
jgi:hypothetical protein